MSAPSDNSDHVASSEWSATTLTPSFVRCASPSPAVVRDFVRHSNRIEGEPDEPGVAAFDDHLRVALAIADGARMTPRAIHKRLGCSVAIPTGSRADRRGALVPTPCSMSAGRASAIARRCCGSRPAPNATPGCRRSPTHRCRAVPRPLAAVHAGCGELSAGSSVAATSGVPPRLSASAPTPRRCRYRPGIKPSLWEAASGWEEGEEHDEGESMTGTQDREPTRHD